MMYVNINNLNDIELTAIFEAAEENPVNESLFSRCRDELRDSLHTAEKFRVYDSLSYRFRDSVHSVSDRELNNAAIELSREKWKTMNKAQKIEFLRDVHGFFLFNNFFE